MGRGCLLSGRCGESRGAGWLLTSLSPPEFCNYEIPTSAMLYYNSHKVMALLSVQLNDISLSLQLHNHHHHLAKAPESFPSETSSPWAVTPWPKLHPHSLLSPDSLALPFLPPSSS